MHSILALVASDDPHVGLVIPHLAEELVVIDPRRLATGYEVTYQIHNEPQIKIGNEVLKEVRAVWCRASFSEALDQAMPEVTKRYRQYARHNFRHFVKGLYAQFPDATWVSPYFKALRASHKPLQLVLARQLGFNVPATIITNNEDAALAFVKAHPATIVKPIVAQHLPQDDLHPASAVLAARVSSSATAFPNLHLAPAIFQEAIMPAADIRVIVVDTEVFAASIHIAEGQHGSVRDWRAGQYDNSLRVHSHDLPPAVAAKCRALILKLGLKYGAIDLLRDIQQKYWFLENNTSGAWGFIEKATGQPIGKAIARVLMGSKV